jgi:uncharacterized protein (DUF983 family)
MLDEMELGLEVCGEKCPHCGAVNLLHGFSEVMVFTCKQCGKAIRLAQDPHIDRVLGEE